MKSKPILVILAVVALAGCTKTNPEPSDDPIPLEISQKSKQIITADNCFGFELFDLIAKEASGQNVIISPLSISTALSMALNGAGGTTRNEMIQTLHFDELFTNDFNVSMKELTDALTSVDPKVTLDIANSIWYRQDFSVLPAFLDTNKTYYNAEVASLDFTDPSSKDIINHWVADQTNNKITEIVDRIDPMDIMYLINAIYFKGIWKYTFEKENTEDHTFHTSPSATIEVPTMMREGDFAWFHNDHFTAVELDYGQGNYSMVILLPDEEYTLPDITSKLTAENWTTWMNRFDTLYDATMYLPKFSFRFDKELNNVLNELGMKDAFDSDLADFSNINPDYDLFISSVLHKTFIEINEEGTEAAAVTSVTITTSSIGPSSSFVIDHPFLFVIREKTTGAILFLGQVINPLQE